MALPVKKKRILPSWMKGAAKRTGLGLSGTKTTHGAKPEASRAQVSKTPNKTRPVQPMSKAKCKTISAGFWHHSVELHRSVVKFTLKYRAMFYFKNYNHKLCGKWILA